jgi:hypothetical protein
MKTVIEIVRFELGKEQGFGRNAGEGLSSVVLSHQKPSLYPKPKHR